ncbi:hypothetical protein CIPAW_03G023300 [Carya illinoinensis]|uniref:Uncharacterized protein n=1 Tax=Carya illinoinensis TaxID=32201 RepID=A0A8T1QXW4_CARIL|nr:hypothetical protein CIPAW_03G023300 [Carya illinoinensis]KAG6719669.1 hypothetical protein I3842_03G018300 [Carya illinoinensis]
MKAIILICVLLASLLFSSPSVIVARKLLADQGSTGRTGNRNNPGGSCGSPRDPQYSSCVGRQRPIRCEKKTIFGRCQPPQGT